MSLRRAFEVFRIDLAHNARRPIFWVLIAILALTAWGLSTGHVHISSGDSDVGGRRAFITSEFAIAHFLALLFFLYYGFFVAVAAGLIVIRDDELNVGELLHSTPLTVGEYVWGKFAAVLVSFLGVLALHLSFHAIANHVFASAESGEYIGPFRVWNYLWPALVFAVPTLVFVTGASFYIGAVTRRPILVFFLPLATLILCLFFFWEWSPSWLPLWINRALMLIDPSAYRWLEETWLKLDRGAEFYNTQPIGLDAGFVLSRLAFAALGLLAVLASQLRLQATLRGSKSAALARAAKARQDGGEHREASARRPIVALGMSSRPPGLLRAIFEVARVELRELKSQPGLYLFVPLILLLISGETFTRVGAFDTPLLNTPGQIAAASLNLITVYVSLLLLFYTVESLERERGLGLAAIYHATPVRTASILFGKTLANSFVGVVILLAALLASFLVVLFSGKVSFSLWPFVLLWGGLAVPTFVLWCAFTTAVFSIAGNRYATYATCLGALIFTGYMQARDHMNWVGNWDLWSVVSWSDMGPLELWKKELLLNRALALALSVLFTVIAVRFYSRRALDASNTVLRLQPMSLLRGAWRLSPFLAAPIALGTWLYIDVQAGFQGDAYDKKGKDYWRKNIATWKDAPLPSMSGARVDLDLEPQRRWFKTKGEYTLINDRKEALRQIPVTAGPHYENLGWSLDGEKVAPENRAGLFVFTPKTPLAPGASLKLGFEHEGQFPKGATKNGGGTMEFILPSGVVLTSFGPGFVPSIGFMGSVGVDEDNHSDPKVFADDFYVGQTDSGFGNNVPCTTHLRISAPEEYTINSVGTLISEEISAGRRTVVWESDHPVSFFNVVAGKWAVKRGEGTAIYYHPEHAYNIDEMLKALNGARKYYSEWFYPYPWKELKLSEFPNYDTYAQGFPTNITFSEGIGFLTESEPEAEVAFMVTSHEAAHQWWGNILTPGKGPGGDILSEGMAHFSTALLMGEVQGLQDRIEFLKQIETRYGDRRQVDSEKPLVKIDGSRPGDETTTYDKGGWVFWMLLNEMGRDNALAGCRAFIQKFEKGPDHPVLQDFVEVMREHAPDKSDYDAFVKQWFFDVVVPEYKLSDASKTRVEEARADDGAAGESWEVKVHVENAGTSTMPLEIAATRGERFPKKIDAQKKAEAQPETAANVVAAAEKPSSDSQPTPKADETYHEARTTITLGPKAAQDVVIRCRFEPKQVIVDPDALVLQLRRKTAVAKL